MSFAKQIPLDVFLLLEICTNPNAWLWWFSPGGVSANEVTERVEGIPKIVTQTESSGSRKGTQGRNHVDLTP